MENQHTLIRPEPNPCAACGGPTDGRLCSECWAGLSGETKKSVWDATPGGECPSTNDSFTAAMNCAVEEARSGVRYRKLRFFSYDPNVGFRFHATAREAQEDADTILQYYRDEARDCWSKDVENLCWGEIVERVRVTHCRPPMEGEPYEWDEFREYGLAPVRPTDTPQGQLATAEAMIPHAETCETYEFFGLDDKRGRDVPAVLYGWQDHCTCSASSAVREVRAAIKAMDLLTGVAQELGRQLNVVWHAMGCPFDHCERCIADADTVKALRDVLGPPSGPTPRRG